MSFLTLIVLFALTVPSPSSQEKTALTLSRHGQSDSAAAASFQDSGFTKDRAGHQTSFGAEQSVRQPVSLPSSALKILQTDSRNQTCLPPGGMQSDIPESWFVASHIPLRNSGQLDLIVLPVNSCLNGANVSPFWVFRRTRYGYEVVLTASGLVLDVLNKRTNKYRDIRVTSASSNTEYVTLYRFNGRHYSKSRTLKRPLQ